MLLRSFLIVIASFAFTVLLRKSHTDLLDAAGKPSSSFDQIMMIYAENGAVCAEFDDGTHVIHYTSAVIAPGRSVTFDTAAVAGVPSYRLTYQKQGRTN